MVEVRPGVAFWPVKPDCPAPKHNTLRAATGRLAGQGGGFPKCVCDRALELLEIDRKNRREANRRPTVEMIYSKAGRAPATRSIADTPESMRNGACTTPDGFWVMDAYQDRPNEAAIAEHARALCFSCPAKGDCLQYIVDVEQPPGTWAGMYAGLSPAQRRAAAKRRS